MRAMLFAAGLGTRLGNITQHIPKALVVVNGKTLLQRNLEYLKSYGITDFVINVHHFSQQIINYLEQHHYFGCTIQISDESNALLETGGGMLKARHLLGSEDFLVMNVDILTDLDIHEMITFHQQRQPLVTLAVSNRESSRKLLFDENMTLCGWKNLATGETIGTQSQVDKVLAFSGIHLVNPKIFCMMLEVGKFSIMQTYMRLMHSQTLIGYDHTGTHLLDVGKPESISKAAHYFL